jgi:hypothetical protein
LFHKGDEVQGLRFLKEALPLISTYFSGESVKLAGTVTSIGDEADNESTFFADYIRLRHAAVCCAELIPIVQKVENGLSNITATVRTDTAGMIRGRLDVPRYVSRRALSFSWPRTYPILVTADTPQTPENALVVRIFRILLQRMPTSQIPPNSAESMLIRKYRKWIIGRLKRYPWANIVTNSSLPRLYLEASRRIARRQTGNERAYSQLIQFVRDCRLVDHDIAGATSSQRFAEALLSFPSDEAFLDRIYEIWCLRSVAGALVQIGAELISGPMPLVQNRKQAIYSLRLKGMEIEVWFQKSLPSEHADWRYEDSSASLRGIPDICVLVNKEHRMLIDAKNRLVTSTSRSEETYKMLGYFENFRAILGEGSNWGCLAFVSTNGFSRTLFSYNGRRIELISAHPVRSDACKFESSISRIIEAWLTNVADR